MVLFTQDSLVWPVSLSKDEVLSLTYTVDLPEYGGVHEATTEVAIARGGVYEMYQTISHAIGTERTLGDVKSNFINGIKELPRDKKIVDSLVRKSMIAAATPEHTARQMDLMIDRLLGVADDLNDIGGDTLRVRLELDRLLRAYGRKWFNMMLKSNSLR
jgi:hypothetical protein